MSIRFDPEHMISGLRDFERRRAGRRAQTQDDSKALEQFLDNSGLDSVAFEHFREAFNLTKKQRAEYLESMKALLPVLEAGGK